jgi:hypothetical protein
MCWFGFKVLKLRYDVVQSTLWCFEKIAAIVTMLFRMREREQMRRVREHSQSLYRGLEVLHL